MDVKRIANAVSRHWSIENNYHWCLDVTHRENESRIREARLRENFAWLNRFSLSLLNNIPQAKASRCNAAAAAGTSTRSSNSSTHKGLSVRWPWPPPQYPARSINPHAQPKYALSLHKFQQEPPGVSEPLTVDGHQTPSQRESDGPK